MMPELRHRSRKTVAYGDVIAWLARRHAARMLGVSVAG